MSATNHICLTLIALSNWFWWCSLWINETKKYNWNIFPTDEDKFSTLTKITSNEAWNESVISMLKWHEGTGRDLTSNSAFFIPILLWTFYHVITRAYEIDRKFQKFPVFFTFIPQTNRNMHLAYVTLFYACNVTPSFNDPASEKGFLTHWTVRHCR